MPNPNKVLAFIQRQPRWRLAGVAVILLLSLVLFKGSAKTSAKTASFAVRRGPLDISVLEGGSIQALESQEIKCEVRVGYQGTKILKIVEEGYQVTDEDVKTNKVLVELDSSELQKQIVQQEIQYQSAVASLTDAQQGYDIQLNQNISDIKAAEQKARFARMDFDKFLGDTVTEKLIAELGLDQLPATPATNEPAPPAPEPGLTVPPRGGLVVNPPPASGDAPKVIALAGGSDASSPPASASASASTSPAPTTSQATPSTASSTVSTAPPPAPSPAGDPAAAQDKTKSPQPDKPEGAPADAPAPAATNEPPKTIVVDFSKYATIEALGDGEAKQKLRKFEDDLQVAQKELGQAKATLEGTRRLFDKGFVSKIDLEHDEIAYENNRLKVQTADTARDLFLKYEFAKSSEEALSKYSEALRELDRARKAAVSKLAQADAKLKSAQGNYNVQLRQRKDFNDQLEKCVMRAKKTGLIVYGGGGEEMFYYGGQEPIREGATVRERQAIITIPDMTKMSVKVKIHETYIKKVKKGQKVRITVDAFPDQPLKGEVTKVGVLPDSQNRWMNPDLKVYLTTITIDGTYDWIKPGMSAKVEIFVDRLEDVVYAPIQSVSPVEGKQFCYLVTGLKPERREVEIGQFNDEFIEIKKGLKEGDKVLLHPPESGESEGGTGDAKKTDADKARGKGGGEPEKKAAPAKPSAPGPAPAPAPGKA